MAAKSRCIRLRRQGTRNKRPSSFGRKKPCPKPGEQPRTTEINQRARIKGQGHDDLHLGQDSRPMNDWTAEARLEQVCKNGLVLRQDENGHHPEQRGDDREQDKGEHD